jgi:hypothetical protein
VHAAWRGFRPIRATAPVRTCESGGCQAVEAELRAGGLDALDSARAGELSLASFVGNLRDFFLGKTTTGVGTARATTPRLVGPGQTWQRGATAILCNTTPRQTGSGSPSSTTPARQV